MIYTDINIVPVNFSNPAFLERVIDVLRQNTAGIVEKKQVTFNLDEVYSSERNQYFSTKLIAQAVHQTAKFSGKSLIIVEFDLFIPIFTFVFGEAQLNGNNAIVSLCRLHEEFYSGKTNNELLFERTMKEVYHELGHTFGLVHCRDWGCVMHASAGIAEVDIKGSYFCDECSKKLNNAKK